MEPKELQVLQHQMLDAIQVEPTGLTKKAFQACYELVRLTWYIKRKDRVGISEKTVYAARAFSELISEIESYLGVEAGKVDKLLKGE